jgi:hypothetical protein
MANPRPIELDELVNRPGTYFNPQTEVLLIVDDSTGLDAEVLNLHEFEDAEWVLVSDETPVDEHRRDELLEALQVPAHLAAGEDEVDEDADELDEESPEPDPE